MHEIQLMTNVEGYVALAEENDFNYLRCNLRHRCSYCDRGHGCILECYAKEEAVYPLFQSDEVPGYDDQHLPGDTVY